MVLLRHQRDNLFGLTRYGIRTITERIKQNAYSKQCR